jgi:hypothetical protein
MVGTITGVMVPVPDTVAVAETLTVEVTVLLTPTVAVAVPEVPAVPVDCGVVVAPGVGVVVCASAAAPNIIDAAPNVAAAVSQFLLIRFISSCLSFS